MGKLGLVSKGGRSVYFQKFSGGAILIDTQNILWRTEKLYKYGNIHLIFSKRNTGVLSTKNEIPSEKNQLCFAQSLV